MRYEHMHEAGVSQQGHRKLMLALQILVVFLLGLLFSATAIAAENTSVNSSIDVPMNLSINATDMSVSQFNESLLNLTNATLPSNETEPEFLFSVVLEKAKFVNVKLSQFIPELNITENTTTPKLYLMGYMDSYLLTNASITPRYSGVELDVYSETTVNGTVVTDLDICTFYINGTNDFVCLVPNASSYTVVATTDYLNETYTQFATFNQSTIAAELLQNGSITTDASNASEEEVIDQQIAVPENATRQTTPFTVAFAEAYTGSEIFGTARLNTTEQNTTITVAIWPIENKNSTTLCSATMGTEYNFSCAIAEPRTGLYAVNVTAMLSDENRSVYEVTYLEAPELRLRIAHDATYNITDKVPVRSFATYDGELVEPDITLEITTPGGTEYSVTDSYPYIEFIADELGYHEITATTTYKGQNITTTTGLVVGYYGSTVEPTINRTENMTNNTTVAEAAGIVGVDIENVTVALDHLYEINSLIPVELFVNSSANMTVKMNATINIIDPANTSVTYITEVDKNTSEIIYLPTENGNYSVEIGLASAQNRTRNITKSFRVLNKTAFGLERFIAPAIARSARGIVVDELIFNETEQTYAVSFDLNRTGRARLYGIPTLANITHIQSVISNDTRIQTEIFAIDEVNVTSADITLEKTNATNITRILYCVAWNETTTSCPVWLPAKVPFTQNATHISFTVDHFTAYAGGLGNDSVVSIWDISDSDKENITAFIDTLINFTANYTDNNTAAPITTALCNITIDGATRNMPYSAASGIYWYNTTLATNGFYEYNISCSDASYDPLNATDDITVYSRANISSITTTGVTLGYTTEIVCGVTDGYSNSALENYNVGFTSDIDGFLGTATTNASGNASLSFTPSYGTHTITCNISDNETGYYKASLDTAADTLNTYLSRLHTEKTVTYNSSGTYNITLHVENNGLGALYNVTIADFVPDDFTPTFSTRSDWNVSVSQIGLGTIHYWNISSIAPQEAIAIEYSITTNATVGLYNILDSYIMGETYSLS